MTARNFNRFYEAGVPAEFQKVHMLEGDQVVALCGRSLTQGARWRRYKLTTEFSRVNCSSCARKYHLIKVGESNVVQVEG